MIWIKFSVILGYAFAICIVAIVREYIIWFPTWLFVLIVLPLGLYFGRVLFQNLFKYYFYKDVERASAYSQKEQYATIEDFMYENELLYEQIQELEEENLKLKEELSKFKD